MHPSHLYFHRSRFVDYSPPSITALAFSHPHLSRSSTIPTSLRLAIGRSNGDIEIWNPAKGTWFHESTLKGGKGRSIEGLAWIQDTQSDGSQLRLFSVGYSSVVTEWDLERGRPKKHVDCNGGVIWSLAAQPRILCGEGSDEEDQRQDLVVGLDDGSVTLLTTDGGPGSLEYKKTLAKSSSSKARILSLAWQNRHTVVAGMADSTIRVWDIRSGRILTRMALGRNPTKKGGSREALVWAVRVLPNGDIISGDSRGEVMFWDGKTYSLRQRIKAHEGDVLTMDINRAGDVVVASGVDRRTVLFGLQKGGQQKGRWAEIVGRRIHSHDVRAVVVWEGGSISTMVSGGIDMTPVIAPFAKFLTANHRVLQAIPQKPIITCLPQARLLISWYDHEVKVWSIDKLDHITNTLELSGQGSTGRKLVSRLILDNEENITNAHIIPTSVANAGYILAISTIAEVKIFHLRPPRHKTVSYALRVSRVEIPTNFVVEQGLPEGQDSMEQDSINDSNGIEEEKEAVSITKDGARLVQFSSDGKWLLVITPESKVVLIPIETKVINCNGRQKVSVSLSPKVFALDRIPKTISHNDTHKATPKKDKKRIIDYGNLGSYPHSISRVAFSHNSRILVVTDLSGHLDAYILRGSKWVLSPTASLLPKLEHPIVAMEFRPSSSQHLSAQQLAQLSPTSASENSESEISSESHTCNVVENQEDRLMVLTTHKQDVFEFHTLKGRLTAWSRRNPPSRFTPDFKNVVDLACGIVWEIEESGKRGQTVFTKERVWFWGPNWIWMFDLQQDFPNPDSVVPATTECTPHGRSNKRKRGSIMTGKIKESIPITSSSAECVDGDGDIAMLDDPSAKSSGDEDEDDDDEFQHKDEGDDDDVPDPRWGTFSRTKSADSARHSVSKPRPRWCHYKYRPIMALLPIGEWGGTPIPDKGGKEKVELVKEMVVVERPAWDIELPPAFFGRREKTIELRKSIWT